MPQRGVEGSRWRSVRIEGVTIVESKVGILQLLLQQAVSDDEHFDLGTHQTAERVFGRAGNGFAAHIETGVHQHGTAGPFLECAQQRMKSWIRTLMHCL